jgi:hypothetical protein
MEIKINGGWALVSHTYNPSYSEKADIRRIPV